MEIIRVMLPILVMLAMGFIFQKTGFIKETGMDGIKTYLIKIGLPVTIFHAMAIADLSKDTLLIIIVMFLALMVAMIIGFLLRPLVAEPYKKYVPFLITVFEGGMFSYPLYQNLCGADRLVNIVVVDVAGCIFGFGIFYGILDLVESNTKFNLVNMGKIAIKTPTFDGVLLGLLCNVTGIMKLLLASPVADTYIAMKDLITAPMTAMILLYVGYNMKIEKSLLAVVMKTIVLRMIVMAILCVVVILMLPDIMQDVYMLAAFLIMFVTVPTFSLPSFTKDKEAASYFAMTASMYVIVTIIGYAIITAVLFS